jgi:hypothetical protein
MLTDPQCARQPALSAPAAFAYYWVAVSLLALWGRYSFVPATFSRQECLLHVEDKNVCSTEAARKKRGSLLAGTRTLQFGCPNSGAAF